jgi:hypothetical protein
MKWILPVAILLVLPWGKASGYYPINCFAKHAATDYSDSDEIVIARVIKLERLVFGVTKKRVDGTDWKYNEVIYRATLKVGRAIKGTLKKDDEFEMFEGSYIQSEEDDAEPTWLGQCNSHPSAGLRIDRVCLMFLRKSKTGDGKIFYEPRSCHYSTHSMAVGVDETTDKRTLLVHEDESGAKEKPGMPVNEFLAKKKAEAEQAKKEEKGK